MKSIERRKEMKQLYSHAFDLSFVVVTDKLCNEEEGSFPTPREIADAIRARVDQLLEDDDLIEAIGLPWDTYTIPIEAGGVYGLDRETGS